MTTIWNRPVFKKFPAVLLGLAIGFTTTLSFAVHDEVFELDTANEEGGNIVNDGNLQVDWEDLFDVAGDNLPTTKGSLPAGFGPATFIRDFVPGAKGPDSTAYTGGSADTDDIGEWACTRKNNIGNKFNILNTYATAYIDPDTGDTMLYFALERKGNEGTAAAGFWFLKDGTVGCQHPRGGGSTDFTGHHADGDLLIIADFTGGGKISDVFAYVWEGGADGALNTTPIPGTTGDCADAGAMDGLCATVNQIKLLGGGPGPDIPWLTESQQPGNTPSNDLDDLLFMEGGINLTANGLSACFATYHATTRSSDSLTSEKHDYATGSFPLCSIGVSKSCQATALNADNTFNIDYSIVITNTGPGSFGAVESVVINDVPSNADSFTLNTETVGSYGDGTKLDAGETLTVTGSYASTVNGGSNTVNAKISLASTGFVVADEYSIGCDSLQLTPLLSIVKNCSVSLSDEGNYVAVKKDYDVTVCNTGDVPLSVGLKDNVDSLDVEFDLDFPQTCLVDSDCATATSTCSSLRCQDASGNPEGRFGGSVCEVRIGSYLAESIPSGTAGMLTNTATAKATSPVVDTGVLASVGQSDSATCDLCPLTVETP